MLRDPIPSTAEFYLKKESLTLNYLLEHFSWSDEDAAHVSHHAVTLIESLRAQKQDIGSLENFMNSFSLNTDEGLAMMCLAEALLRIPDKATRDALIRDKIMAADWGKAQQSADLLVKAAGFGLLVTKGTLNSALNRVGAPFIRTAVDKAMGVMGSGFVLGQDIDDAMKNAKPFTDKGYSISYDMLGEGARTFEDADIYFQNYKHAVETLAQKGQGGMSVKLSALYPRYEYAQNERCIPAITEKLITLCEIAAHGNVQLLIDAEEVERLELSIAILDQILPKSSLQSWDGLGLAVQAYQKRALPLIAALESRAVTHKRRLNVRLVKGAYWDREIKRAQVLGLDDYPVFTRKCNTDTSYMVCAQALLKNDQAFNPLFGTHNAHTVTAIMHMGRGKNYTLQRLHGMGERLFETVMKEHDVNTDIYAPVGPHRDLLAYLVRRLLENGANSSFVNKVLDKSIAAESLAHDPSRAALAKETVHHPAIPLPIDLYKNERPQGRLNSSGHDYEFSGHVKDLAKISSPPNLTFTDGETNEENINSVFKTATAAFAAWNARQDRTDVLNTIADLYDQNRDTLMGLLIDEGKKTIPDAEAEIREAIDFCRYYANQAMALFDANGTALPGPTGEDNRLYHEGRGVFVCISPWNFPLAITTGQIVAALVAGNTVIAKPAEQTPCIAALAVDYMYQAGVPKDALHLVTGGGDVGAALVAHAQTAGVAFTGSTTVAQHINRALAAKDGAITPLIAETGGQNCMIVDSSALPEQVVDDVILSAFGSAGQRCSALRILCVQEDIADKMIAMIKGAMETLSVGDPALLSTDIPPVIDTDALAMLRKHKAFLDKNATHIATSPLGNTYECAFPPSAYEIPALAILEQEVFGPILHIYRYKAKNIKALINDINTLGYGLTCGVHSRIDDLHDTVRSNIRAGNIYINRSMIGAVVGSQPFGGMGLSGTGPKAGGPHYLHAFATEKTVTIDTTASGGNTALVSDVE